MGDIFNQVGQAFVQAIPTIVFVALLLFILRRIFFRPLAGVLKAREELTKGAVARAKERTALAESRAAEYEALWLKARQQVYSQREADRKAALAARDEVIRQARVEAEATVRAAQAVLAVEADVARQKLAEQSSGLVSEIVQTILAGAVPPTGPGEARS